MRLDRLREVFDKTKGRCHFCGDRLVFENVGWVRRMHGHWEADHVFQRGKGGRDNPDNYLPACTRCNRLRWDRTGHALREVLLLGLIAQAEVHNKKSSLGRNLGSLRRLRIDDNAIRRMTRSLEQQMKSERITARQMKTRKDALRDGASKLTKLERRWLERDLSYGRLMTSKARVRREMGLVESTQSDVIPPPQDGSA